MALHDECVDKHPSEQAALIEAGGKRWTFGEIQDASQRLATNLARAHGVRALDRVAIIMPQRVETALLHVACSRLGAISVPLSPLFGPDGLKTRLDDAQPKIVYTTPQHKALVAQATSAPIATTIDVSEPPTTQSRHASGEEPMFLVYTSGTTGQPKGALLPHRVIAGRMPGFLLAHEGMDPVDAIFYSPADWSWIGGLHDSLFAPWHAGVAVLSHERTGHFDPEATAKLMAVNEVTDAFFAPTALKAFARSGIEGPHVQRVHSAGEPIAAPVALWARRHFAWSLTEVYGLTECAFLVGTAGEAYETPEGSMGKPYPGHFVEVRDEEICARKGDPTMMLGYWQGEGRAPRLPLDEAGYLHTGDLASADETGFFRYLGRKDDLIKTSGYRVGPAEVESVLLHHPAVAECAVVGVPDEERGQRVKAFVKLAARTAPTDALKAQLQAFVKSRLAAHAYPRDVEFVTDLPVTVSGKIQRRLLR